MVGLFTWVYLEFSPATEVSPAGVGVTVGALPASPHQQAAAGLSLSPVTPCSQCMALTPSPILECSSLLLWPSPPAES